VFPQRLVSKRQYSSQTNTFLVAPDHARKAGDVNAFSQGFVEAYCPVDRPSTIADSQIDPSLRAGTTRSKRTLTNVNANNRPRLRDHSEEEDDSEGFGKGSSSAGTSDGENGSSDDENGPENDRTQPTGTYETLLLL